MFLNGLSTRLQFSDCSSRCTKAVEQLPFAAVKGYVSQGGSTPTSEKLALGNAPPNSEGMF